MRKWARISLVAGLFLLATALIWSIAAGRPIWDEFYDACADENGCTVWGDNGETDD
jgi:hypothetical protein